MKTTTDRNRTAPKARGLANPKPLTSAPPLPAPLTPEWNLLWDEVHFLRETIQYDATKPGHQELHDKIRDALAYTGKIETEENHPDASVLLDVLDTFYAMPEVDRRVMLNGWTMTRWPSIEHIATNNTYQPMLVIDASKRYANGVAYANHHLELEDSLHPISLRVKLGVTKTQVLHAVWDLWHVIETQWPLLAAVDPLDVADEPLPVAMARVVGLSDQSR